jgi:hypothetical protein
VGALLLTGSGENASESSCWKSSKTDSVSESILRDCVRASKPTRVVAKVCAVWWERCRAELNGRGRESGADA